MRASFVTPYDVPKEVFDTLKLTQEDSRALKRLGYNVFCRVYLE